MIGSFSIGIDIVEIDRFKKMNFTKNKKFYSKIFTNSEIEYCLKFKDPYTHFAGKFALKEALKKSINMEINFLDILTLHINSKPKIQLKSKKYFITASISHEKKFAIAVVICQKL